MVPHARASRPRCRVGCHSCPVGALHGSGLDTPGTSKNVARGVGAGKTSSLEVFTVGLEEGGVSCVRLREQRELRCSGEGLAQARCAWVAPQEPWRSHAPLRVSVFSQGGATVGPPPATCSEHFCWGQFLRFVACKEGLWETDIVVRGGWPTVSGGFPALR